MALGDETERIIHQKDIDSSAEPVPEMIPNKVSIYFWRGVKGVMDGLCVATGLLNPAKKKMLPPPDNGVVKLQAHLLVAAIKKREVRAEEVIRCYIERIQQVNGHINALVDDAFTEALTAARAIDEGLSRGDSELQKLPLLGLPFTAKDSTAVKGQVYAAGSWHRRNIIADFDAPVITRMKEAGAIFLGITNVPEILLWWDSTNLLFGRTSNPFDLSLVAGGSSGGEAALISARGSLMGIGSDIGGSLRIPSSFCGIVGHKPSPGLVIPEGMFPSVTEDTHAFATFGPLGRCVQDVALLLSVMIPEKEKHRVNFGPDKINLAVPKWTRIYFMSGIPTHPLVSATHPEILNCLNKCVDYLKDNLNVPAEELHIRELFHTIDMWAANMKKFDPRTLEDTLAECTGSPVNSYMELAKSMVRCSNHTFNLLFFTLVQNILSPVTCPTKCKKLVKLSEKAKQEIRLKLGNNGVLICPTVSIRPPKHNTTIFKGMDIASCVCINVLGLPSTQVPCGTFSDGIPIGIQVVAGPDNDLLALSVANVLDKVFNAGNIVPY